MLQLQSDNRKHAFSYSWLLTVLIVHISLKINGRDEFVFSSKSIFSLLQARSFNTQSMMRAKPSPIPMTSRKNWFVTMNTCCAVPVCHNPMNHWKNKTTKIPTTLCKELWNLLALGVFGDGLGAFRHGVLGKFTRQDQSDWCLDFSGWDCGFLVVSSKLGCLSSNALEDIWWNY